MILFKKIDFKKEEIHQCPIVQIASVKISDHVAFKLKTPAKKNLFNYGEFIQYVGKVLNIECKIKN